MAARRDRDEPPEQFQVALAALRAGSPRPEVVLTESPAPQRLAPYSVSLAADVVCDDDELASGRLVLLHDPAGHETWQGVFRLVTYVRAEMEPEIAADPMLPAVGWAWLVEALEARGAGHVEASGTVTRVASESFGAMADRPGSAQVEIRASWTPLDADMRPHLAAWCELLCTTAGLPPAPPALARSVVSPADPSSLPPDVAVLPVRDRPAR